MQEQDDGDAALKIMALVSRAEAVLAQVPGFQAPSPLPHGVHATPDVSSRQAIAYARLSDMVGALCSALTAQLMEPAANDPIQVPRGTRGWWSRLGWMLASHQAQDIATQSQDKAVRVALLTAASSYVSLALAEAWQMADHHGHNHMIGLLSASSASISMAVDKLQAQGDGLKACQRMAVATRDLATAAHRSI